MSKEIKAFMLANELGINALDLVEIAKSLGINCRNHMDILKTEDQAKITKKIVSENNRNKKLNPAFSYIEICNYSKNINVTVDQAIETIYSTEKRYENNSLDQKAGFIQEATHVGSFNVDAAIGRSGNRAELTSPGTSGDYEVKSNGKTVCRGEVKYYKNAEKTENAMRGYEEQQRVGPSDQIEEIKYIANRKYRKNKEIPKDSRQRVAKEHKEVADSVSDSINYKNDRSKPYTSKQSKELAVRVKRGQVDVKDVMPSLRRSVKKASFSGARVGAKYGAASSIVFSALENYKQVSSGNLDKKKAIKKIAVDTVKGSADGAIKGAVGSTVKVVALKASSSVISPVLKNILRSSAPASAAIGMVEMGYSTVKLLNGNISDRQYKTQIKTIAFTTTTTWGGVEAGMALGTFILPGPGTFIGGFIGGLFGHAMGVKISQ